MWELRRPWGCRERQPERQAGGADRAGVWAGPFLGIERLGCLRPSAQKWPSKPCHCESDGKDTGLGAGSLALTLLGPLHTVTGSWSSGLAGAVSAPAWAWLGHWPGRQASVL